VNVTERSVWSAAVTHCSTDALSAGAGLAVPVAVPVPAPVPGMAIKATVLKAIENIDLDIALP
jgi:hypothetical protein